MTDKHFELYFAYGSNMNQEQMKVRCPNSIIRGVASLNGYEFYINSRGVAGILENPNKIVYGVVWEISPEDLDRLDRYEGVKFQTYFRKEVLVDYEGSLYSCLVYIANDQTKKVSKSQYLERIIETAKTLLFPDEYIEGLIHYLG